MPAEIRAETLQTVTNENTRESVLGLESVTASGLFCSGGRNTPAAVIWRRLCVVNDGYEGQRHADCNITACSSLIEIRKCFY